MHWTTLSRETGWHRRAYWKCRNIDVKRRNEKWCGMYGHICDNLNRCSGYKECPKNILVERANGKYRILRYSSEIIRKRK